jgi:hypothetical protein
MVITDIYIGFTHQRPIMWGPGPNIKTSYKDQPLAKYHAAPKVYPETQKTATRILIVLKTNQTVNLIAYICTKHYRINEISLNILKMWNFVKSFKF